MTAAWNARTEYVPGDQVTHGGSTYRAQAPTIGAVPPAWPWEAEPSGTSGAPDSWLFANLAADLDPIPSGSQVNLEWADPSGSMQGTDLSWDAGTPDTITVNTAGLYEIYVDLPVTQTADADGLVSFTWAGSASYPPDLSGSLLEWLYTAVQRPIRPSAGTSTKLRSGVPMHLPPARMAAGDTIAIATNSDLAAGSVLLRSSAGIAVVRLA